MQTVISDKETRISKLEGELKQAGLDLKQLQGQLVVKEEQLVQTQENIQKVGLVFWILIFKHSKYSYIQSSLKSST